jgi:hypothetical protein
MLLRAACSRCSINNSRMYRRGHAEGAKGEITGFAAKMSARAAGSLPVAQLQRLEKHKQEEKAPAATSKYHVHIGAGRLGLGLVIPALARGGSDFAILQRPSGSWKPVTGSGSETVGVKVNGTETIPKMVLLINGSKPELLDSPLPAFACTDDAAVLKVLFNKANTYSTSLGPALSDTVLPLLANIPAAAASSRPALYACENDHAAVEALGKALEGRVDVVNCMVDRICTGEYILLHYLYELCVPRSLCVYCTH